MADQVELTGKEFLTFQQKALDYLYDMPLGNDSLFIAKPYILGERDLPPYRVKKVTFGTPKLNMQYDEKIRRSVITGVEYSNTVTIEWNEDAFNSVQKFHLGLIDSVVDLNTGLFRVGGGRSKLNLDIYHFAYVEGNADAQSPFDSVAFPKCTEYYSFVGLIPEGIGDITFDSDSGGSLKTVSVTYHCNDDTIIHNQASASSNWIKDDVPTVIPANADLHLI
jgi:triacylglycerol esterase/lipase EstA (alpha/beta hydrolase family)